MGERDGPGRYCNPRKVSCAIGYGLASAVEITERGFFQIDVNGLLLTFT